MRDGPEVFALMFVGLTWGVKAALNLRYGSICERFIVYVFVKGAAHPCSLGAR
jgi:hypothetical protein